MYFLKDFIYLFSWSGRQGEREGEKRHVCCHLCTPIGDLTWPATQACALAGNGTGDPLGHRPALNPLSHTSQGHLCIFDTNLLSVF